MPTFGRGRGVPEPIRRDCAVPNAGRASRLTDRARHEGGLFQRFLLSGAANTLLTYLLYLLLLDALGHRLAYSAAFVIGVGLAYSLNRIFVFKSHAGWRSVLAMPLIYLLQYGFGLGVVEAWVAWLQWPRTLAPLGAIVATLPLTYMLTRLAFLRN
jgi:putative flippase GtrA